MSLLQYLMGVFWVNFESVLFTWKSTKLSLVLIIALIWWVLWAQEKPLNSKTLISVNFPFAGRPAVSSKMLFKLHSGLAGPLFSLYTLLSLFRRARKHIYPPARLSTKLKTNSAALHLASSSLPADRCRSQHKVAVYSSKFLLFQPLFTLSCCTRFSLNP